MDHGKSGIFQENPKTAGIPWESQFPAEEKKNWILLKIIPGIFGISQVFFGVNP